jgi:hypothetical protein
MGHRLDTEEKQKDWRCFVRRQLGKAMPDKPPAGYRAETETLEGSIRRRQWTEASPGEPPGLE